VVPAPLAGQGQRRIDRGAVAVSQSGFIIAVLLAGFVLWLAANGRLAFYAAALMGRNPASATGGGLG
jgi:hypothetical protein